MEVNGPLAWMALAAVACITVAPMTMLLMQTAGKPPTTFATILMAPLLITDRIAKSVQSHVERMLTRSGPGRK